MRLTDLPPGLLRVPATAEPLYVPPPLARIARPSRRTRQRLLTALALAGVASALFVGRIGDQSAFASIGADTPTWVASLRAPDPGVALSPHIAGGTVTAAIGDPVAATPSAKEDSRLPVDPPPRALDTAIDNIFEPATDAALPRAKFVPVRADPGAPAGRATNFARASAEEVLSSNFSAYAAPADTNLEAPFDLLLGETDAAAADPARPYGVSGGGRDHWWSDRPLPNDVGTEASLRCLTEAIYFEARSESEYGQRAVAQVVINRVKNPAYPDDVCGVVYQNRKWRNGCQFTFACDRVKDVVLEQDRWTMAKRIAREYASGLVWLDDVGAATHYHATHAHPGWAKLMNKAKEIGNHVFYITKGGGWT